MRKDLMIVERTLEERERLLIEAVVSLARSLREERERLAARLAEVDRQLATLADRLETRDAHLLPDAASV